MCVRVFVCVLTCGRLGGDRGGGTRRRKLRARISREKKNRRARDGRGARSKVIGHPDILQIGKIE